MEIDEFRDHFKVGRIAKMKPKLEIYQKSQLTNKVRNIFANNTATQFFGRLVQ
jgi:hypothetical protein